MQNAAYMSLYVSLALVPLILVRDVSSIINRLDLSTFVIPVTVVEQEYFLSQATNLERI